MGASAAFFDLDRTILKGASGPLLTEALIAAGIVPDRSLPGHGLLYRVFDLIGESLPSIALARGAAIIARGWSRAAVVEAARDAAERLDTLVAPYARPLLEEHRAAGRPVVLATTTPRDLVEPFAERMGFDDVVATQYAHDDEGYYTGGLAGGFVWGLGKLAAVRAWAQEREVDLASSFAYSDSVYDVPLLSAVAHPYAVNPDPRLLAYAAFRRWPVLWLDVPPGVPKLAGLEPFDLVRLGARAALFPYARFDTGGVENIPNQGPAIIAANHRSYFDPVAVGLTVVQSGRPLRFLGKKEVFDAPVLGALARAMGGIRVDRGAQGAGDSLREATRALQAGELVAIMPQGTIPRGSAFFDPVLQGKSGAARLAAATKAPVIPVGLWGTERVWPRSAKLPNVLNVANPPEVRVRVGQPVELSYDDTRADTKRIMEAIRALLPPESREAREPTAEDLSRTEPAPPP
ncbi:MAG: HAD-IB family hydrolase [Actinobacteria bacterium]|nr:HAD-IB family hydrolase [Actinomycetota bacterium]